MIRSLILLMALACLSLSACVSQPGPSVPFQSGQTLETARFAVQSCAGFAPNGGRNLVAGSYVAGVVLGGLVLGPVYVASNERSIRATGEAGAVDRCLNQQGFVRRDLTSAELRVLNGLRHQNRQLLLSHLIGGGTLASFQSAI